METINLEIVTPNGLIYSGKAVSVTLPGEEGEFGVLPRHATLTTLLNAGVIDIEKEDKSVESVVVNWGFVQVNEENLVVLVDGAVAIRGSDDGEIANALESARNLISDISDSKYAIASVTAKIESVAQRLI
jgi:F-type H+-transporting ATPase subunit epsilon